MATDYAAQLVQAKAALHALVMGDAIVSVTVNGRTNQYTPATEEKLRRYIAELESEVGDVSRGYRGPVRHYS